MATLEQQLEFERKQRELGQEIAKQMLRKAEDQGRLTDTPVGTGVLRHYLLWLSQRIATDISVELGKPGRSKAHAPLLRDLDPDAVSLLTLSTCVNKATQRITAQVLAHEVGKVIYGELVLNYFKDMNADLYETLANDLSKRMSKDLRHRMTLYRMQYEKAGITIPEWSVDQKIKVGSYLLSLIDGEGGLIEMSTEYKRGKTVYMYSLTEAAAKMMQDSEARILEFSGIAAPCLIPPADWDNEGNGGFHGALRVRAPRFFKGRSSNFDIMVERGCDFTMVLKMLNHHQKVAWKVNPFIVNVVKEMRKYSYETKDIRFTTALAKPERPEWLDTTTKEQMTAQQLVVFKEWKRSMAKWHTDMRLASRKEAMAQRILMRAVDMMEHEEFYFVYQVDYRGRMYPVSSSLNPQGTDLQKAIMHSAHGMKITDEDALKWFKLNIASKYGIDKLAIDDCVKWTEDNHDNIIRAASDPMDRDAWFWWSDADKPLQFLALCDEYKRYHEDPENFVARIAVAMDGTCNGLQNYSALLRDEVGGRATNLLGQPGDAPNDIYGDVAQAGFKRLVQAAPSAQKEGWMNHGLNRKLTKKSTMTLVYGSTFGTCRDSIIDYCNEQHLFEGNEYEMADYCGKMVWDGIGDVVVKAREAMAWLKKVSSKAMRKDTVISWLAPSGFRVVQVYQTTEKKRVQTAVGAKVTYTLREEQEKPDKRKHSSGIAPNFIHSVDAAHMAFVSVALADRNPGLFMHMIHDDFGALPGHAQELYQTIREEFVRMHEGFSLSTFNREYQGLPAQPTPGNLNLADVLSSPNFFR